MKDGDTMENYKELYYHLFHEVEQAQRILEKAQQDCEEMYLAREEAEKETEE